MSSKPTHYECGICDHVHPWKFNGDCRDNKNRLRHDQLPSNANVASWEERQEADNKPVKEERTHMRLIDLIEQQDAVQFKDTFNEVMSTKVANSLEEEKVVVAKKFFGEDKGGVDSEFVEKDSKGKKAKKTGGGAA